MKASILAASVEFIEQPFLKPMQISSGLITKVTEARVTVRVRLGELEGRGRGSIYLSDLWAWPGLSPARVAKDAAMRELCLAIAESLFVLCGNGAAHPLELGLRLHHSVSGAPANDDMPLSTLNGVELNSPQYTPSANQPWLPRLSGLFQPRGGQHRFDFLNSPGLGSALIQIP